MYTQLSEYASLLCRQITQHLTSEPQGTQGLFKAQLEKDVTANKFGVRIVNIENERDMFAIEDGILWIQVKPDRFNGGDILADPHLFNVLGRNSPVEPKTGEFKVCPGSILVRL
jgi:hypothetical protein